MVTTSEKEYKVLRVQSDRLRKETAKQIRVLVVELMRKQLELQREQEAVLDQMTEDEIESAMSTLSDDEICVGTFDETLADVLEEI